MRYINLLTCLLTW